MAKLTQNLISYNSDWHKSEDWDQCWGMSPHASAFTLRLEVVHTLLIMLLHKM